MQHEDLVELLDVGSDVVMREHDALGVPSGAAGENNCGHVVELNLAFSAGIFFNSSCGETGSSNKRGEPFAEPGFSRKIFDENSFRRGLRVNFF